MKIFNWVHRKFHHRGDQDGFGRNVKKAEVVISNETETEVLLQHVTTLPDVLGGILSIGTFGFDPLSADFNPKTVSPTVDQKQEEPCDEEEHAVDNEVDEENDFKECDEELSPLVFRRFGCDSVEENASNYDENPLKADMKMANIYGSTFPLSPQPYEVLGSEDDKGKKKRERTTLAELFLADSYANTKRDRGKPHPDSNKKLDDHQSKKGLSFAKKLIPRVGEDTSPTKKLHQLMKRMLKRKIHPDLEGKTEKRDSQIKPTVCGLPTEEYGANESLSLLQTEDAMV